MDLDPIETAVERLGHEPLPVTSGFPPGAFGKTPAEIVAARLRLHDHFSTPIASLDAAALEHNLATMAAWCRDRGVELVPHGKTTMAPQLFARQLAHGASGITAATPAQVRVMRWFGVPAVQLANQLVQPSEAAWLAGELAKNDGFAFTCWVDSVPAVDMLDAAGRRAGVTFDVLLEIGVAGGRTGCRTDGDISEVTEATKRSAHVRLVGVAGYEGSVAGDRGESSLAAVRVYLRDMRAAADRIATAGGFAEDAPVVLSAGGSMFYDLVVDELTDSAARVVLRSGCYISHDHGLFHRNSPLDGPDAPTRLQPALTVWGTVLSRPEPDRAFLDVGRRNASFDQGLPMPLRHLPLDADAAVDLDGLTTSTLNDQHTFLHVPPDTALNIGDRVQLGISHPCTTFDKWRHIPVVDAGSTVVDVVRTYF